MSRLTGFRKTSKKLFNSMKKAIVSLLICLVCSGLFSACKSTGETAGSVPAKSVQQPSNSPKKLKKLEKDAIPKGAPVAVDSLSYHHPFLHIHVTYQGGCEAHSFELFHDGNFAKSLPPQASLILVHSNGNDPCRQWISEEIRFDVSDLLVQYKKVRVVLQEKSVDIRQ